MLFRNSPRKSVRGSTAGSIFMAKRAVMNGDYQQMTAGHPAPRRIPAPRTSHLDRLCSS